MSCKIFLNDNILNHITQRGIARYFRHIADGIIAHFGNQVTIYSPEVYTYGQAKYIRKLKVDLGFYIKGKVFLETRFHDYAASWLAQREQARIFYSPYYGNVNTKSAEIFTVYDMTHEVLPHHFPLSEPGIRWFIQEKRRCLERASALIAISHSTANDIVSLYPDISPNKIFVVHLGVDKFFFEPIQPLAILQKPYFVYVGLLTSYKNFLRLLIAFGQSGLAQECDLRVIVPGPDEFNAEEIAAIEKYKLQNSVHFLNNVNEEVLRASYANAIALAFPSEYEGFGFPVLEAMASGTLVAASNKSSLPEVGGDVAFYFDPYDTDSVADCLLRVAHLSSAERRERIERGIARAREFTWERCVRETVRMFESI